MLHPERLLNELSEVWASLGKQANGESSGVLRACSMTFVVLIDNPDDAAAIGQTLAELMPEHPSRAIVVRLTDGPEPALTGRAFAQCWRPPGRKEQICSEQIEIVTANRQMQLEGVARVILGLTVPDLPVVLWARCALLLQSPAFAPVVALASKVIMDTAGASDASAALKAIDEAQIRRGSAVGDLAWTRLTPWREGIARIFEDPAYLGRIGSIADCDIGWNGANLPTAACYMAGWLSRCLRRAGGQGIRLVREGSAGPSVSRVGLRGPGVDIVSRLTDESTLEVQTDGLATRLAFPQASDYRLLREELAILARDPIFCETLSLAHRFSTEAARP